MTREQGDERYGWLFWKSLNGELTREEESFMEAWEQGLVETED